MADLPKKLKKKLQERKDNKTLRNLKTGGGLVDFVSNDYLGLARDENIFRGAIQILESSGQIRNGSSGSRLLSGNTELFERTETYLAQFYGQDAALIFNSGYDANIGLFSSVPQRGDLIVYDEYIHASMRDGIRMSLAKDYKYKHNDLEDLRQLLSRILRQTDQDVQCYVATEAVFSMDGDAPDLRALVSLCSEFKCRLILDEAHAIKGSDSTIQDLKDGKLAGQVVFARIVTFGKAMGVQGAAVLGGMDLKTYLLNYARSFIYTTALPPMSTASVLFACQQMNTGEVRKKVGVLRNNIVFFLSEIENRKLQDRFIPSSSAIHCCLIPGNARVRKVAEMMENKGFDVRPILAPTVPEGMERIRFCLHSFNTHDEIKEVLSILACAIEEIIHA